MTTDTMRPASPDTLLSKMAKTKPVPAKSGTPAMPMTMEGPAKGEELQVTMPFTTMTADSAANAKEVTFNSRNTSSVTECGPVVPSRIRRAGEVIVSVLAGSAAVLSLMAFGMFGVLVAALMVETDTKAFIYLFVLPINGVALAYIASGVGRFLEGGQ